MTGRRRPRRIRAGTGGIRALAALALAAAAGCVAAVPAGPPEPLAADFPERRLVLVFEDQRAFRPLSGRRVRISVSAPARLLAPADGTAVTGPSGALEVVYRPVAVYDESALAAGDVVADFPAVLSVSMDAGGDTLQWQVDDTLSYARYRDPLYQGLDRDPDPGPSHVNLYVP
ncbi:MAG: hypothetical protein LBQ79_03295 [Deltaproteobacteria bacterium]|jgi:hypothetical protein|nr:hypothetical protein [Deltaproteobacteria bacterium]